MIANILDLDAENKQALSRGQSAKLSTPYSQPIIYRTVNSITMAGQISAKQQPKYHCLHQTQTY